MAQKPREIGESELEDRYREMLSNVYGSVEVCGMEMDAARVLEEMDPIAFRCGFVDWLDSECGETLEYDSESGEYYEAEEWAEYLEEVEAEEEEEEEETE